MRLIDADALRKEIHCAYSDDLGICEVIDNQPTAYNVEKVVEQMKETGKRVCASVHCNDECQDCEHGVLMCNLLEIVRNGGKE